MKDRQRSRLEGLGDRLQVVDFLSVDLLKRRMDLALDVIDEKMRDAREKGITPKIFRPKIETKRLAEIAEHARKVGINPHFARAMLYSAIGESCKVQMVRLQKEADRAGKKPPTEGQRNAALRRNLLRLTRIIAPTYDASYDTSYPATSAYLQFEEKLIGRVIDQLPDHHVMVDLGCATGTLSCRMAKSFERVVGYDISPHMLGVARTKAATLGLRNVGFREADLEAGIPEADGSVSFVAMNLGTASDVRGIDAVISEIRRMLKSDGRFVLSFYNRDALIYRWAFIPWDMGLAAVVNVNRDCLDVHARGKILSVYAHAYTPQEVDLLFDRQPRLTVGEVRTYPTMSSILPAELFKDSDGMQSAVAALDEQLSDGDTGAYIVVSGTKL